MNSVVPGRHSWAKPGRMALMSNSNVRVRLIRMENVLDEEKANKHTHFYGLMDDRYLSQGASGAHDPKCLLHAFSFLMM